jgi:hypothetical protein
LDIAIEDDGSGEQQRHNGHIGADNVGNTTEISEMQGKIEGKEREPRKQSETETQRQVLVCRAGAGFK